jgi:tetratricopeptide (TPR) repeat protein
MVRCDDEDESLAYRTLATKAEQHYAPAFALDGGNPHLRYLVDKDFELFKMETKEHLQEADRQSTQLYEAGQTEEAAARDMLAVQFLISVNFAHLARGILARVASKQPKLEAAWETIVRVAGTSSESSVWAHGVLEGSKDNHLAQYYLGMLLEDQTKHAASSHAFEASISVHPTAKALLKLGSYHHNQGKVELAIDSYEASARLLGGFSRLPVDLRLSASAMYARLGDLHRKRDRARALWAYGEAYRLNPLDASIASKWGFELQADPSTHDQAIEKLRLAFAGQTLVSEKLVTLTALQTLLSGTGHVICIVAYDQPEGLQKVLDSLRAATGVQKYTVLFFLEPEPTGDAALKVRKVHDIARAYDASLASVHVNRAHLGYGANVKQALKAGFEAADFVITLRDDFELAEDALVWMEQARLDFAPDEDVLVVATHSDTCQDGESAGQYVAKTARRKTFTTGPWGMWKDRYTAHQTRLQWESGYHGSSAGRCGDSFGKFEVFPLLPRSNAVDAQHRVPFWASSTELTSPVFDELAAKEVDHVCVSMGSVGECSRSTMCRDHLQGGLTRIVMMEQARAVQQQVIDMYKSDRIDAGVARDMMLVDYLVRIEAEAPAKQILNRVMQAQPENIKVRLAHLAGSTHSKRIAQTNEAQPKPTNRTNQPF